MDPNTQPGKRTLPTFICVDCNEDFRCRRDYDVHHKRGKACSSRVKCDQSDSGQVEAVEADDNLETNRGNMVDGDPRTDQPVDVEDNYGERESESGTVSTHGNAYWGPQTITMMATVAMVTIVKITVTPKTTTVTYLDRHKGSTSPSRR